MLPVQRLNKDSGNYDDFVSPCSSTDFYTNTGFLSFNNIDSSACSCVTLFLWSLVASFTSLPIACHINFLMSVSCSSAAGNTESQVSVLGNYGCLKPVCDGEFWSDC
jgi:hypothetical protein